MACLEMRRTSRWWYARYRQDDGKTVVTRLAVKIRGERPASLRESGDQAFERSRVEAQTRLDDLAKKLTERVSEEALAQAVFRARTGRIIGEVAIQELPDRWAAAGRKRELSERYADQCRGTLGRFISYLTANHPGLVYLHQITHPIAQGFMAAERARGVTAKTWNDTLVLLQGAFARLRRDAGLADNPFDDIVQRDVDTVFRQPFRPQELKAILDAAESDAFVRPIIVTAACTAMRLGDCCNLKWKDVDLEEGFITVKTAKTRATADIPIFPMLYDELVGRRGSESEYVFPEQSERYKSNPGHLTARLRRILARVGFCDGRGPESRMRLADVRPDPGARTRIREAVQAMPATPKREKVSEAVDLYLGGLRLDLVAGRLGMSKGTISGYLNEVEAMAGVPFIRGKVRPASSTPPPLGPVHVERPAGLRRGSVRDFHSFRTTWVTLALTSNIPVDLVRKVTGHQTVDVVLTHYFRPHREQLRKALQENMPRLLTDGVGNATEQALALLRTAEESNWREVVGEAIELLEGHRSRRTES